MKITKNSLTILMALFLTVILSGCTNQNQNQNQNSTENQDTSSDEYVIDESDFIKDNELIEDIPESELDEKEIAGLTLMREEEKLARDVYNTLGEKWGQNIFTNIAKSEQTHTDAVKALLERYNIEDPVADDNRGIFTSSEIKDLYELLVEQGNLSIEDAYMVGATVEDLDIKDLNTLLEETDNEDIIITYNNLKKGSRNHLRAYVKQIENNGDTYTPQYISQEEYDSIISSGQERGRAN